MICLYLFVRLHSVTVCQCLIVSQSLSAFLCCVLLYTCLDVVLPRCFTLSFQPAHTDAVICPLYTSHTQAGANESDAEFLKQEKVLSKWYVVLSVVVCLYMCFWVHVMECE